MDDRSKYRPILPFANIRFIVFTRYFAYHIGKPITIYIIYFGTCSLYFSVIWFHMMEHLSISWHKISEEMGNFILSSSYNSYNLEYYVWQGQNGKEEYFFCFLLLSHVALLERLFNARLLRFFDSLILDRYTRIVFLCVLFKSSVTYIGSM